MNVLNLFAPINKLGCGIHSFNMATALEKCGIKIKLYPPSGGVPRQYVTEKIDQWLKDADWFFNEDPSLMIFDCPFLNRFCGEPRIGFAVFEKNFLSNKEVSAIGSCDLVLTPSKWGKDVLLSHGIYSHVVHEGFNPELFYSEIPIQRPADFTVVSVGKFEERKGTLQLIDCFAHAFENEDATLILHCRNPFLDSLVSLEEILRNLGFSSQSYDGIHWRRRGLKIHIGQSDLSDDDMRLMYNSADVAVFLTKAEGWGLPILEAIACGVPTIAGSWTGQSEYIDENYPDILKLQKYKEVPMIDGAWFNDPKSTWHVPDNDEVIEKLRWAKENINNFKRQRLWSDAVARIHENFTWNRAAGMFIDIIYGGVDEL